MSKTLVPRNGFDDVQTPPIIATAICEHFRPSGCVLEPCCGDGVFVRQLSPWASAELQHYDIKGGRDFLHDIEQYDWIVTNPPWSKFRAFLEHAMKLAPNIVFLATLNHFQTQKRMQLIRDAGFGVVEYLHFPHPRNDTWPRSGFPLVAGWVRKGWEGSTHHNFKFMVNEK